MPSRGDYDNEFPYMAKGVSREESRGSGAPPSTFDFLASSSLEVRTGLTVNGNIRQSRGTLASSNFVSGSTGYSLDAETGIAEFTSGTFSGTVSAATIAANTVTGWLTTSGTAGLRSAASGERVQIQGADHSIRFYSSDATETRSGTIDMQDLETGDQQRLNILGHKIGDGSGGTLDPQIFLYSRTTSVPSHVDITGDTVLIEASQILGPNGAVDAPAYSFTNDEDCGMYRINTNLLGISAAGVLQFQVSHYHITNYQRTEIRTASDHALDIFDGSATAVTNATMSYIRFRTSNDLNRGFIGSVADDMEIRTQSAGGRIVFRPGLEDASWIIQADGDLAAFGAGRQLIGGSTSLHMGLLDWWRSTTGSVGKFSNDYDAGAADGLGITVTLGNDTDNPGTGDKFMRFRKNVASASLIGSITGNGSGGVAFNTTSDQRLKHDIRPIEAAPIFDKIEWRSYEMDYRPNDSKVTTREPRHGVVAQELHRIPELRHAVTVGMELAPNETEIREPWTVDYAMLVPILGAKIVQLETRLAAVEVDPQLPAEHVLLPEGDNKPYVEDEDDIQDAKNAAKAEANIAKDFGPIEDPDASEPDTI